MKTMNKIFLILFLIFSPLGASASDIDQDTLCSSVSWKAVDNVGGCKVGQKIGYLPSSFGNEQLPILFIALNCDVRFNISLTNGGAVCIFKPVVSVIELH